jgi:hypothetical protein
MFEGSCHCGKVAFTIDDALPTEAMQCNCSHCRRKGLLLAFYPPEKFVLARGEGELESYFFNKHAIEHQYCATCGVQPFAQGKGPDGKPMRSINLRCVDALDLDALKITRFDGASL